MLESKIFRKIMYINAKRVLIDYSKWQVDVLATLLLAYLFHFTFVYISTILSYKKYIKQAK